VSRLRLALLGLLSALALAACGAQPLASWPGLAVDQELAYVAYNNQVVAVNLADGKKRWSFPPEGGRGGDVFLADPAVGADVVVVGSEGPLSSYSGAVFGLNRADGAERWCLALDSRARDRLTTATADCPLAPGATQAGLFGIMPPEDNRVIAGIALADGVAYVAAANQRVYALDALTGEVLWTQLVSRHPIWATPVVAGDRLYIASLDHVLYARDRATGNPLWEKDLGGMLAGSPALVDDVLYIGTYNKEVVALDVSGREPVEKWRATAENAVWGGPQVKDGVVYFSDLSGGLYAVDAATGAQKWRVTPGGMLRASPAIAGDLLFIGDKDGRLHARRLTDGSEAWTREVAGGGQLYASPLVLPEAGLVLVAPYQGSNWLVIYNTAGNEPRAFAPSQ